MKIVHIEISAPFIDGWGYQENLLPEYLQKEGVENYIIASANIFPKYLKKEIVDEIKAKGDNYLHEGIVVRRIPIKKISTSFLFTSNLMEVLEDIQPDVIFHHNFNCTSMPVSARYARKHNISMLCDNHADSINMSRNRIWVWFYYKFLIRLSCQLYKKQLFKVYGVTHSRCDFIYNYYGLSQEKIDFLPIGADVDLADSISSIPDLRLKYGYDDQDFIVVSGGKMGKGKGTDKLICAVKELSSHYPQLKLVLFGKFEDSTTSIQASNNGCITNHGWCNRTKTLEMLKMSDVACWPIHHTTLIEDAIAVCTPIINRKTGTSEHLIEGNGLWIEKGTKDEIKNALLQLLSLDEIERNSVSLACEKMKQIISYHTIAQKVLEDISKFKK